MASEGVAPTIERDRLPVVNDEITADENRYRLLQILGDGGYGTVFLSQNAQNRNIAVKTEKYSKSMLHIEVNVLKAANAAKCKHFCQLYDYAIEELHSIGFISRDIKPGNFAPGHKATRQGRIIFMYDFGLARRYLDKNRNLIPSRKEVGWRGTTRYGSLIAHKRMDLSRRDDIESWFYMLIEITKGSLPWRLVTDRTQVYAAKTAAREGEARVNFLSDTPPQYNMLLTWIDALVFEDTPPYSRFYSLLDGLREEKKIRMHEHWDWEDETSPVTSVSESKRK
ncbi:unnamed protein product [Haemonchus placei]|uniref:Protein kinase domain-containing protein n=1 Tax=Haemonchus placei TaxID=6290 RepID=A0A0N4W6R5_HAEPC|nr:unnamed protein product [Haemonchus placei]